MTGSETGHAVGWVIYRPDRESQKCFRLCRLFFTSFTSDFDRSQLRFAKISLLILALRTKNQEFSVKENGDIRLLVMKRIDIGLNDLAGRRFRVYEGQAEIVNTQFRDLVQEPITGEFLSLKSLGNSFLIGFNTASRFRP
jgi:hypothetical protein